MAIGIKTGGRKKGSKNKVSRDLQVIIKEFVESEVTQMPKLTEQLSPKERIEVIIKLLPFVIPKVITEIPKQDVQLNENKRPSFMDMVKKHMSDCNINEDVNFQMIVDEELEFNDFAQ